MIDSAGQSTISIPWQDLHPASTPESESDLHWETPPVLGAVRDEEHFRTIVTVTPKCG